jgi:hypothetical protein
MSNYEINKILEILNQIDNFMKKAGFTFCYSQ